MNNRPELVISLEKRIEKGQTDFAKSLIQGIQSYENGAGLDSLNEQGQSLLNLALNFGRKEIADSLLELQKNNHDIIFGTDNSGYTCLWVAAMQGYDDIVETIIQQGKNAQPNTPGYNIFLKPDHKGNTPLHVAVTHRKIEVVKVLLQHILKDDNAINEINRRNSLGNAALHLACFANELPVDNNIIHLLIQSNADLRLNNLESQSSIHLISQRDISEQEKLLEMLDAKWQLIFLGFYHEHAHARHDESIKNNYRALIEFRDLNLFSIAKNHFDENAQNYFKNECKKNPSDNSASDDLLEEYDNLSESSEEELKLVTNNLAPYQVLVQDQDTLKQLTEDLEKYLRDLQVTPKNDEYKSMLVMLAILMVELMAIVIDVYFGKKISNHKYPMLNYTDDESLEKSRDAINQDKMTYQLYIGGCVLTSIFVLVMLIPAGFGIFTDGLKVAKRISRENWDDIISGVRAILLDKLKLLEEKQQNDKEYNYLPTSVATIRNLETTLATFDNKTLTIYELINMVNRLDQILIQIKTDMLCNNKPLYLGPRFYKSANTAVFDIEKLSPQDEERIEELSDDENEILLGKGKINI